MEKIYAVGTNQKQPEGFSAFIPGPFPVKEGYRFNPAILKKSHEAVRLLGKLDGITQLLPEFEFFLLMYLRKDAAASSQIEGTQATLINAIEVEIKPSEKSSTDVDDILHYIQALNLGLKRVKKDQFPLSLRLIRELHKTLMKNARSSQFSNPGEFRESQNWINGTRPDNARFVPPPVSEMKHALSQLEKFIHTDDDIPNIIKAALLHAQFETIHPFLDGNGRTGRMLITLYLWHIGYLENPILYLSSYFKQHQQIYYNRIEDYHNGKIDSWVDFFLDGVIEIAESAITSVAEITSLRQRDMMKISQLGKRASESAMIVFNNLFTQPIVNVARISKWTDFSQNGAQKVIDRFIEMDILFKHDENVNYGQQYFYKEYLDIFNKEA